MYPEIRYFGLIRPIKLPLNTNYFIEQSGVGI